MGFCRVFSASLPGVHVSVEPIIQTKAPNKLDRARFYFSPIRTLCRTPPGSSRLSTGWWAKKSQSFFNRAAEAEYLIRVWRHEVSDEMYYVDAQSRKHLGRVLTSDYDRFIRHAELWEKRVSIPETSKQKIQLMRWERMDLILIKLELKSEENDTKLYITKLHYCKRTVEIIQRARFKVWVTEGNTIKRERDVRACVKHLHLQSHVLNKISKLTNQEHSRRGVKLFRICWTTEISPPRGPSNTDSDPDHWTPAWDRLMDRIRAADPIQWPDVRTRSISTDGNPWVCKWLHWACNTGCESLH